MTSRSRSKEDEKIQVPQERPHEVTYRRVEKEKGVEQQVKEKENE